MVSNVKSFILFLFVVIIMITGSMFVGQFLKGETASSTNYPDATEIETVKAGGDATSISSWVDPETGVEYLIVSKYRSVAITPRVRP